MDIKQLKRFLDVCETKSFTKTAENLFISQQALSSSISAMEEELGSRIFSRTTKGVVPTEEGLILKEKCTPLVQCFDDMISELTSSFGSKKGRLVLGLVPEVLRASIPDLLLSFREAYPDIELKVIESVYIACFNNLVSGMVDIAFCPRPHDESLTEYINLREEKIYAVVNKDSRIAQKQTVSLWDLKEEKIITFDKNHQIYHKILTSCRAHGFTPRFAVESGESSILLSMVRTNMCVFICMEHIAVNMDESTCVRIPIIDKDMVWEYGIAYRKDKKLSHSAKQFVDFLKHCLQP